MISNYTTKLIFINDIDINKLNLSSTPEMYKLFYNLNTSINIRNPLTKLEDYKIYFKGTKINIYSNNFGNLYLLDQFLTDNIHNYNTIFYKNKIGDQFIILPLNIHTRNIEKYKSVYIYIKYVKKHNNIPIIHLLYGDGK